ncbi:MAG: hypothetical protein Ct9H300mP13_3580 [Gammaproteobacteria bacterium]|nr:MAG: hypothetical protein Ct9H300mP13_3580 [Gammaproteobacteria bacterium]
MAGYIIACFDDVGLDAARNVATAPVVGICEASVYVASMVAGSFAIVTTLPSSIPAIERCCVVMVEIIFVNECVRPIYQCWDWKREVAKARL